MMSHFKDTFVCKVPALLFPKSKGLPYTLEQELSNTQNRNGFLLKQRKEQYIFKKIGNQGIL